MAVIARTLWEKCFNQTTYLHFYILTIISIDMISKLIFLHRVSIPQVVEMLIILWIGAAMR